MFDSLLLRWKLRFSDDKEYYKIVQKIFGIYPNNIELYKLALVHRSASLLLSDGSQINNERLEFLGDAIIESIVSDFLFIEYPDLDEGDLTKLRSRLVSRSTLNNIAVNIGLDRYIISHDSRNLTVQQHIFGDALEAMIGAIYLDKGYEFANRLFINDIIRKRIDLDALLSTETDYKSRLIEWSQKNKRQLRFSTSLVSTANAPRPLFSASVIIDGKEIATGEGNSKKEAEQIASMNAVEILEII